MEARTATAVGTPRPRRRSKTALNQEIFSMFKFLGIAVLIIFLIGLAVVLGLFNLIF
ncbi:hypothetical protein [Tianweitania sediminis]|jgi:hypothetical protein|uniref:Uncharacterized protein n=1 Tax=Tianweitania sediminis TaxID=1502156 RepID=A0A8J7UGF8_9HYPH|nr:hypothetical protein [Tianweitania sediminis]MBP0438124.1 hypothetical protein [Tianweitania sediminis]HEV7418114.1 hypothetical protein [Tianweitania sediminis]